MSALTVQGYEIEDVEIVEYDGITAPNVSSLGKCRIYFDQTTNKLRISQNGEAYTDMVSSGGGVNTVSYSYYGGL